MSTETKRTARMDTKKLTTLAVMCAIAFAVMAVGRIPISPLPFLKYDPKDIVIVIGGFIYGPMSAVMMSAVVSLIEMVTVSDSGPIGLVMNVLSTCAFACTATLIYKKKQTMSGAVIGLISGVGVATIVMLLWNFFITPFYMGVTREAVEEILVPMILPFNLIKYGINAALALLLYKPIVTALRRAHLVPESTGGGQTGKINIGMVLAALVVLATCIFAVLVMRGII